MKKKILLLTLMIFVFVCIFAISVSAAGQGYSTFEVTLSDGTTKTAYTADMERYEGRIYLNSVLYAEAPLDSDGTYTTINWSDVKVLDFSNTKLYRYDNGNYVEMEYGSNQNNTAMCLMRNNASSDVFASIEKVITGKIVTMRGAVCSSWASLKEIVVSNNLKEFQWNSVEKCTALEKVTILEGSNLATIGQQAFIGCTKLESFEMPDTVTSMGTSVFSGCTSLESVKWSANYATIQGSTFSGCTNLSFEIPSHITTIGGSAFSSCTSLTSLHIPASVTSIGSDCWRDCTGIKTITFDPNCKITAIYAHTFQKTAITEITLPNTVERIAQSTFNSCPNLTTVNLGAGFVDFNASNAGQPPFTGAGQLKYLYVPVSFTADSVRNCIFTWNDNNSNEVNKCFVDLTMFYTGTKEQAQAIINKAATGGTDGAVLNTYLATMQLISETDYKKAVEEGTLEQGVSGTPKRYLVYDCNICDAFYNGKCDISTDDHDCTTALECIRANCGRTALEASGGHNEKHEVIYADGFLATGVHKTYCTNENCTVINTDEELEAMFTAEGYSYKLNSASNAGISAKFSINADARALYEKYEGTLCFGIIAANQNHFNSEGEFIVNGELNTVEGKGIKVEAKSSDYSYITCTINGFNNSDAHKALGLVIAGYVYEKNDDGSIGSVTYVQKSYTDDTDAAATAYTGSVEREGISLGVVTVGQVEAHYNYISNKENA